MWKSQTLKELEKEKRNNEILKDEIEKLKSLLEAELQAKENGCHRGNYCMECEHAVLIKSYADGVKCYCAYGQCEHFEKKSIICMMQHCRDFAALTNRKIVV